MFQESMGGKVPPPTPLPRSYGKTCLNFPSLFLAASPFLPSLPEQILLSHGRHIPLTAYFLQDEGLQAQWGRRVWKPREDLVICPAVATHITFLSFDSAIQPISLPLVFAFPLLLCITESAGMMGSLNTQMLRDSSALLGLTHLPAHSLGRQCQLL